MIGPIAGLTRGRDLTDHDRKLCTIGDQEPLQIVIFPVVMEGQKVREIVGMR
ncbi:MAG: hypothetical protein WC683_04840 [bacterium]